MKNLNQYIQEKYLIDIDSRDPKTYFQQREPDFICTNKKELLKIDSIIDNTIVDFIRRFTRNTLLVWKYKRKEYKPSNDIINYRKANNIDINNCLNKMIDNDMCCAHVFVDIKSKEIKEIWINNKTFGKYSFFIEVEN